ncbi:MAG TPA: TolC family protein [Rhodothermales bacterium]|nr:TolC family protein [Rhodothermales bacterium]
MKNSMVRWSAVSVLLSTVFLPLRTYGQEVLPAFGDTLTLDLVIESVKARNAGLEAARAAVQREEAKRRAISSLPEPRVAVTYQPEPILTARGSQRSQLRVEQMIPLPGTTSRRKAIADLGADIERSKSASFLADLVLEAKNAYYDVHRAELFDRLVSRFEDQLLQFEDVALAQYAVGTGMQQAVLKAQLERANLSRLRIQLEADRDEAIAKLEGVIGTDLPSGIATEASIHRPDPVLWRSANLAALAVRTRSELDALRSEESQAGARFELAGRSRYPEFGLNATYFDMAASNVMPTADGRDAFAVGAMVKIPLNRRAYSAEMDAARLHRTGVGARRTDLERRIASQLSGITQRLDRLQEQLDLIETGLVPRAETTLRVTLNDYTNGRAAFLDLLDAERTLFNLQTSEIETHVAYLKAVTRLERTVGIESVRQIPILNQTGDGQ